MKPSPADYAKDTMTKSIYMYLKSASSVEFDLIVGELKNSETQYDDITVSVLKDIHQS